MHGPDRVPDLNIDYERALVGTAIFIESEMVLFYECMLKCARKLLDTADIVREAIYHHLRKCPFARHFSTEPLRQTLRFQTDQNRELAVRVQRTSGYVVR